MTIQERFQQDLKEAMKSKDTLRLDVLRGVKTAVKLKEIEKLKTLAESEVFQVLNTLVKQRKDSIEQFRQGGRSDLAQREEAELKILESYLPPAVGEQEIRDAIVEAISETHATSSKEMGKVMKAVMGKFSGKIVDGKLVSDLVRAQLEGK
jgi:hypothetical protein